MWVKSLTLYTCGDLLKGRWRQVWAQWGLVPVSLAVVSSSVKWGVQTSDPQAPGPPVRNRCGVWRVRHTHAGDRRAQG